MAKHHPDLIFCRKQAGVAIGNVRIDQELPILLSTKLCKILMVKLPCRPLV